MALDIEEEKISELEDTAIEIIHKQAEKKLLSRNEWSHQWVWGQFQEAKNICNCNSQTMSEGEKYLKE